MPINLTTLVKNIHQTIDKTFTPNTNRPLKIYTPGYVSAAYNVDPTFTSAFVSANGIIISFNTEERREPGNERKEFTIFLNAADAEITSETHVEFDGIRWDCKDITLVADVEYIFAVERL